MGEVMFEPVNDQVFVLPDVVDDGGVVKRPRAGRSEGLGGQVFLVGPDVSDVAPGDRVWFPEDIGAQVNISGTGYIALVERDIFMVL